MTIVHRYLLGSFLRNLIHTMLGALLLFTVMDLLDHMGSFVDNSATVSMVGRYYLYKSAWIIDTILPIAVLMAVLFTVGTMARYLELTALMAAGWSLMRITRPLILASVLVTMFSLAWHEYVLPRASIMQRKVWEVEIHKKSDTINPTENIAVRGPDGRMYYAHKFDPNTGVLLGMRVVTRNGPQVTEIIAADRAEWLDGKWALTGVTRRRFMGDREIIDHFDKMTAADMTIDPKGFYRDRIRQQDMNIRQLRDHIRLVRQSGGNPLASMVDIQFNLAFPFVNIIVTLMGIILASSPRKTTVASGFGLTLLVSFGYYMFMNFGKSLGHTGTIPPVPAAWSGNVFFLLLFLVLYVRARR